MATSTRRAGTGKEAEQPVARKTTASRGVALSEDFQTAHDRLVRVKQDLDATRVKLSGIDPDALTAEAHEQWANEANKVDLASARVRNALLNGIAQAFEAELPQIQSATGRLQSDLARLQEAVDIINAVSGALGVIEQIITLGR